MFYATFYQNHFKQKKREGHQVPRGDFIVSLAAIMLSLLFHCIKNNIEAYCIGFIAPSRNFIVPVLQFIWSLVFICFYVNTYAYSIYSGLYMIKWDVLCNFMHVQQHAQQF